VARRPDLDRSAAGERRAGGTRGECEDTGEHCDCCPHARPATKPALFAVAIHRRCARHGVLPVAGSGYQPRIAIGPQRGKRRCLATPTRECEELAQVVVRLALREQFVKPERELELWPLLVHPPAEAFLDCPDPTGYGLLVNTECGGGGCSVLSTREVATKCLS
jgi:hypothetical protein